MIRDDIPSIWDHLAESEREKSVESKALVVVLAPLLLLSICRYVDLARTVTSHHQHCLMSRENGRNERPCYAVLLARVRQRPRADMRILWDLPLLQQGCKCCTGRAGTAASAKGVDFALFNIPRIAKSLMPADNERKHGGVAEPIRRYMARILTPKRKEENQLKALRFLNGRNVLADYYVYRESIELSLIFGERVLEMV
jgi:hypothetical protein